MLNYRKRVYDKYASCMSYNMQFDVAAARRWGKPFYHYLRGWLPECKDARIADLACGGGKLIHFFSENGYSNISGVDLSPEQVQIARQISPGVEEDNVLSFLQRHKEEFDLITAFDLVEHLTKDELLEFLDCCYASLRPGGRLILQTPNAETPFGFSVRYADFTHELCFTPKILARMAQLCGFTEAEAREQGPVAQYSLRSAIRFCLWAVIRKWIQFYNLVETGSAGSGVFTRVFVLSARKPLTADSEKKSR